MAQRILPIFFGLVLALQCGCRRGDVGPDADAAFDSSPAGVATSDSGAANVEETDSALDSVGTTLDSAIADTTSSGDSGPPAPLKGCGACPVGWKSCSGGCVPENDPDYGCGTGCTACGARVTGAQVPHTTWSCAANACSIAACEPGWADCDGSVASGCETDVTQPAHCGGCGNVCSGSTVCDGGSCVTACTPPKTNCGGTCVVLATSPDHCGACSKSCWADWHASHATATCSDGTGDPPVRWTFRVA